jgi:hypothetical protein
LKFLGRISSIEYPLRTVGRGKDGILQNINCLLSVDGNHLQYSECRVSFTVNMVNSHGDMHVSARAVPPQYRVKGGIFIFAAHVRTEPSSVQICVTDMLVVTPTSSKDEPEGEQVAKRGKFMKRVEYNYRRRISPPNPPAVGLGPYFLFLPLCPSSWPDICILFYYRHHDCPLSVRDHSQVHRECPPSSPPSAFSFTFRSQYQRITLNYVTLFFFLFSLLHCFVQGILQSFLFTADDTWGSLTYNIIALAHTNPTVFPQFTGRHGYYSLELCNKVPVLGEGPHPCDPFFTAGQSDPITIPHRFLPPGAQTPDADASFVRQPFLSSISVFIEPFFWGGQSPNSSVQLNVVSFCPGIVFTPPRLSLFRHHQLGSSTRVASILTRKRCPMGCRISSSRQAMVECPSPLIQSASTLSCIQRPCESWHSFRIIISDPSV